MMQRIFGRNGPMISDKNLGKNLLKGRSKYRPHQSSAECKRRRQQQARKLTKMALDYYA